VEQLSNEPKWSEAFGFSEAAGVALIHCNLVEGNDILDHYYKKAVEA